MEKHIRNIVKDEMVTNNPSVGAWVVFFKYLGLAHQKWGWWKILKGIVILSFIAGLADPRHFGTGLALMFVMIIYKVISFFASSSSKKE